MGFVFYDTETTGTDTAFDQILQFAAIHTDADLNELDRLNIRCRLMPHIVPAPGAMRVTKVSAARLLDPSCSSHYEMTCQVRAKLMAWSPALFLGFNSIQFDEHLLRQALYKTLHPPYLTNTNGNSRSDMLRIAQAASLFAPNALVFPIGENGQFIFKLDQVAPLNGFVHDDAHDALADVQATIFLCRRIMATAPELWSAFMRFSQKAAVCDYVLNEPIFCLADFYFGIPYSWLVTAIGSNPENSSEFYVYNLIVDPEGLIALSDEELSARLRSRPKPVRRLRSNACPIIMPPESAPPIAVAAQLGIGELTRRGDFLGERPELRARLVSAFHATREERSASPHLEQQLYDGFFPKGDEALMERFHLAPWEGRLELVNAFTDSRLKKIGQRLVYFERPDLMPETERFKYDRAIANRIANGQADVPWLTLPRALLELDDLLAEADPAEISFVHEHRAHLSDRLEKANQALNGAS